MNEQECKEQRTLQQLKLAENAINARWGSLPTTASLTATTIAVLSIQAKQLDCLEKFLLSFLLAATPCLLYRYIAENRKAYDSAISIIISVEPSFKDDLHAIEKEKGTIDKISAYEPEIYVVLYGIAVLFIIFGVIYT